MKNESLIEQAAAHTDRRHGNIGPITGLERRQIPTTGINQRDYDYVSRFKRERVARKTKRIQITDPLTMSVAVCCGDGARLPHAMEFHRDGIGEPFFPVTIVGGGAAFHPESPLNSDITFPLEHYREQIRRACAAMKTKKVGFMIHRPCGGANMFQLQLPHQVDLNFMALTILDREAKSEGYELTAYLHIVYGENNPWGERFEETLELNFDSWLDARESYPELSELSTQLPDVLSAL